jgi:hypothetical protein
VGKENASLTGTPCWLWPRSLAWISRAHLAVRATLNRAALQCRSISANTLLFHGLILVLPHDGISLVPVVIAHDMRPDLGRDCLLLLWLCGGDEAKARRCGFRSHCILFNWCCRVKRPPVHLTATTATAGGEVSSGSAYPTMDEAIRVSGITCSRTTVD